MCRSMVDIHSATAEIRRGIKKKKKKQDKNIMTASATQGGHNNWSVTEGARVYLPVVESQFVEYDRYKHALTASPTDASATAARRWRRWRRRIGRSAAG